MKLKAGMVITVRLSSEDESKDEGEELQFRIVHTGGDGTESLSLEAPLARLLGGMTVGDSQKWLVEVPGGELMRVELVEVEEAK